jgi:hypothetical protein
MTRLDRIGAVVMVGLLAAAAGWVGCHEPKEPVGVTPPAGATAPGEIDIPTPDGPGSGMGVMGTAESPGPVRPETGGVARFEELGGQRVAIGGIEFTVSDGWQSEQPDSSMRVVQYALPGADGAEAAQMAVFVGIGGSAEANVERWYDQLADRRDVNTQDHTIRDLRFVIAEATGTFTQAAMGMTAGAQGDAATREIGLIGVVIEGGPLGPVHLKTTGPPATIAAQRTAVFEFIHSARLIPPAGPDADADAETAE